MKRIGGGGHRLLRSRKLRKRRGGMQLVSRRRRRRRRRRKHCGVDMLISSSTNLKPTAKYNVFCQGLKLKRRGRKRMGDGR